MRIASRAPGWGQGQVKAQVGEGVRLALGGSWMNLEPVSSHRPSHMWLDLIFGVPKETSSTMVYLLQ